jgi:hypothetical protein
MGAVEGLTFKALVRGIAALAIIGIWGYMLIAQVPVQKELDVVVKGLMTVLIGVLGVSAVQEYRNGRNGG